MTTSTQTIADFLLARIAEDEEWAHELNQLEAVLTGPPYFTSDRVLAECEAKRRIVEIAGMDRFQTDEHGGGYWTLLHLATVYSDHADYRNEWKP